MGLTRVGQLPAGRPLRARGSRSTQPSQWGLQPFCWVAEGLNPAPALRLMHVAILTDAPQGWVQLSNHVFGSVPTVVVHDGGPASGAVRLMLSTRRPAGGVGVGGAEGQGSVVWL